MKKILSALVALAFLATAPRPGMRTASRSPLRRG